jgi:hypothetical protein
MSFEPKDYEIVTVDEDRSKWWQNRTIVIDWRVIVLTAALALPGLLRALLKH